MATIGGKDTIQKGIVTVIWFCTDDRSLHPKKWNNVFNFQNSPLNILSATALDEYMKDDEGTWVLKNCHIIFLLEILGSKKENSSHRTFSSRTRGQSWVPSEVYFAQLLEEDRLTSGREIVGRQRSKDMFDSVE